jgi:uncharacterized protein (DUF1684 family)
MVKIHKKSFNLMVVIAFVSLLACSSPQQVYDKKLQEYHQGLNDYIKTQLEIDKSALSDFKGLNFFEANKKLIVEANIMWLPQMQFIDLKHTGGDFRPYMKVAELVFKIDGKPYVLQAYQNEQMRMNRKLFIPFTDESNGETSYAGGRYLDVSYAPQAGKCNIDFNYAYAPVCAHIHSFSCPIVPHANHLQLSVMAGERK